jgi:hypothetical protein
MAAATAHTVGIYMYRYMYMYNELTIAASECCQL